MVNLSRVTGQLPSRRLGWENKLDAETRLEAHFPQRAIAGSSCRVSHGRTTWPHNYDTEALGAVNGAADSDTG